MTWKFAVDYSFAIQHNDELNKTTHDHQALVGPFVADYPDYISLEVSDYAVWGHNDEKLIRIKIKANYNPQCQIHQGQVFAFKACILDD